MMNPLLAAAVAKGYVTSPNNIFRLDGVEIYHCYSGAKQLPYNEQIRISDNKYRVIQTSHSPRPNAPGYLDFTHCEIWSTESIDALVAYVDQRGAVVEPGPNVFD